MTAGAVWMGHQLCALGLENSEMGCVRAEKARGNDSTVGMASAPMPGPLPVAGT